MAAVIVSRAVMIPRTALATALMTAHEILQQQFIKISFRVFGELSP